MFVAVLASLVVFGAATESVLSQSVRRDPYRHAQVSAFLLLLSGVPILSALLGALLGWW